MNLINEIRRKIVWSARKLNHPFYLKKPIIDIGSGGNPHPFADVLLEKYLDDAQRLHRLVADRPIVIADASNMPFKDSVFGYSFAFHVLEHLTDPKSFLNEVQRVSTSGYIETPNFIYERLCPLNVHALEIYIKNKTIFIYKKLDVANSDYVERYKMLEDDKSWSKIFLSNPEVFHSRIKWAREIKYEIINDENDLQWFKDLSRSRHNENQINKEINTVVRKKLISALRIFRPKIIDISSFLHCPICRSDLTRYKNSYVCSSITCKAEFPSNPFPNFTSAF